MKQINKGLLLLALAVGLLVGLTDMAMASLNSDTLAGTGRSEATDIDSAVVNGRPADQGDTEAGKLFVGYTKTNGTRTTAQAQSTQDTTYESDTVIGVPAANMEIIAVKDADSFYRHMEIGSYAGKHAGYSGETYPHPIPPESGETLPEQDSVPTVTIELLDTGVVRMSVVNTSNYACTMRLLIHIPDTDFNAGYNHGLTAAAYNEEASAQIGKFQVSLTSDDTIGPGAQWGVITQAIQVPADTRVFTLDNVRIAEDAETFFSLRIATIAGATARDSLSITMFIFPDSGPGWTNNARFTRIYSGRGYVGENDTRYAEGGSQDSVSVWVNVATAIVRVKKTDTIFAPRSYIYSIGFDSVPRQNDTVPGAIIVYTIDYDNDGNRRADSLEFIDYLPTMVDLFLDSFYNGRDTYYPNGIGVDTRFGHARWLGGDAQTQLGDSAMIVEFSNRSVADTEIFSSQFTPFIGVAAIRDSALETVAAIRVRWKQPPGGTFSYAYSLRRDQFDDGTYTTTNALDNLANIDNANVNTLASSDSGDIGRIIFAVVIR